MVVRITHTTWCIRPSACEGAGPAPTSPHERRKPAQAQTRCAGPARPTLPAPARDSGPQGVATRLWLRRPVPRNLRLGDCVVDGVRDLGGDGAEALRGRVE